MKGTSQPQAFVTGSVTIPEKYVINYNLMQNVFHWYNGLYNTRISSLPKKKKRWFGEHFKESMSNEEIRYLPVKNKFLVMWQIKKWGRPQSNKWNNCCSFLYNPLWFLRGAIHQIGILSIPFFLICSFMNTKCSTTRWVRIFWPRSIPFHSFCCTACYTRTSRNCWPCSILFRNGKLKISLCNKILKIMYTIVSRQHSSRYWSSI